MIAGLLALLATAAGGYVLRTVDPAGKSLLPVCQFRAWTGLNCPGCGGTRAVHHLLNGHLGAAFYHNALFVLLLPGLLLWGAWWVRQWWCEKPLTRRQARWQAWLVGLIIGLLLLFGLLRNLPGWPLL